VEPLSVLAATAAAVFAKRAVEEAAAGTAKTLPAAAGRLVDWVRQLGQRNREAAAAVVMVEADPADPARVDLLGKTLGAGAARDPGVASELRALVEAARQAGAVSSSSGGAHVHGNVTGGQVTLVGRDQYNLGR